MAFVHALIEGRQPGNAFVDDVASPRSALVFNHAGFAFALGEPRADLVVPMLVELVNQSWIETQPAALWCTAPAWVGQLRPHFREERSRDEFHFDEARAPHSVTLPMGFRSQPLDRQIATRWGDGLDHWVVRIWGGPVHFGEQAFGIGILRGEALVSHCASCAIGGPHGSKEAEIDIGTAEPYKRRRLATAAAVAFFDQCRARGLTPAWTCDSRNLASRRLAEQLGFTYFRSVVGFRLRLDAFA